MNEDLTVKEKIMHVLIVEGKPLSAIVIAERIDHSRKAVNKNLTLLREAGRVVYEGRTIGWRLSKRQPSGPITRRL